MSIDECSSKSGYENEDIIEEIERCKIIQGLINVSYVFKLTLCVLKTSGDWIRVQKMDAILEFGITYAALLFWSFCKRKI